MVTGSKCRLGHHQTPGARLGRVIGVIAAGANDLSPVNGRGEEPLNGDGLLARQVQGLHRAKRVRLGEEGTEIRPRRGHDRSVRAHRADAGAASRLIPDKAHGASPVAKRPGTVHAGVSGRADVTFRMI
jgi:hypothetical protein